METIGYFEEFIIDGKFIGCKNCVEQKREFGFYGKIVSVASEDIILDNNKKIKKGKTYYTRYYPLNGKIIK